ncbi:MAG TPA: cytochrome c peroxidase, partial [Deinococcales bacterium]|nr:cytochrome c peroxidase [Deinococcales bacterium]
MRLLNGKKELVVTPGGALVSLAAALALAGAARAVAAGTTPPDLSGFVPLGQVAAPRMQGSSIVDFDAAVRLGKTLFWDVQAGSDGVTACATCHFKAGADDRLALNPGPNGVFDETIAGKKYTPGDKVPLARTRTDDVIGSPGVLPADFRAVGKAGALDECLPGHSVFGSERQVTGVNAPSAVGALYYQELFWDGRASATFNGLDPSGAGKGDGLPPVLQAALASQATGPANSDVEMACKGRGLNGPQGLGARLLSSQPLARQLVSATDSVLGA